MKLIKIIRKSQIFWCIQTNADQRILLLNAKSLTDALRDIERQQGLMPDQSTVSLSTDKVLAPIDDQDVWACGVTYFSSRRARMSESGTSDVYDKVYSAERPQIFPKARGRAVIGPEDNFSLRKDSKWMAPEPELVLVIAPNKKIIGYTAGNDFSCRDIEGLNPLYQPQAKIWDRSCSIGPSIVLVDSTEQLAALPIQMKIFESGQEVFSGVTDFSQVVRKAEAIVEILFQHRSFPDGAYLFTGTGIIPPDNFSMTEKHEVHVTVGNAGTLVNGACYD